MDIRKKGKLIGCKFPVSTIVDEKIYIFLMDVHMNMCAVI